MRTRATATAWSAAAMHPLRTLSGLHPCLKHRLLDWTTSGVSVTSHTLPLQHGAPLPVSAGCTQTLTVSVLLDAKVPPHLPYQGLPCGRAAEQKVVQHQDESNSSSRFRQDSMRSQQCTGCGLRQLWQFRMPVLPCWMLHWHCDG